MEYIDVENGKYRICFDSGTGTFWAERNGKHWRDLTGDKMVFAMFVEICAISNKYGYDVQVWEHD